jgi:hypothetical protein
VCIPGGFVDPGTCDGVPLAGAGYGGLVSVADTLPATATE